MRRDPATGNVHAQLVEFVGGPLDGDHELLAPAVEYWRIPLRMPMLDVAAAPALTMLPPPQRVGRYQIVSYAMIWIAEEMFAKVSRGDLIAYLVLKNSPCSRFAWRGEE